jgi:fructokinase
LNLSAIAPCIGVDLGGTKIEALALGSNGEELFRRRIPTPPDYDAMLQAVAGLVEAAEREASPAQSVGVGAPGSRSRVTGLWRNANLQYCNGRDLTQDFSRALGRPVLVENDANCFALSEAIDGAGEGAWTVYGVIAGTGLGGGFVVGGKLDRGANAASGEVCHVPLPWLREEDYPLPRCWCGMEGCAEPYISGTGLARDFLAATGEARKPEEIIAATAHDPRAAAAVERLYDRFARFLSLLVNIVDPEVIVLGGGLSKVPDFCENVAWRVPSYTKFAPDIRVRFVPAKHGDASGVRGAARLAEAG